MFKYIIFITLLFSTINADTQTTEKLPIKQEEKSKKSDFKLTQKEREFIEKNIINISYTDNWTPFSFKNNNKEDGLGFDFWKYIAKKNKIMYELKLEKNFTNALNSIKVKSSDIILTTTNTKDRSEYAIFSDTYFSAPIGIATLQDKNFIPNIEAIKDKRIGVGKNHSAHIILKEIYPSLNFVFIENSVDGLEKLSNNQIDALVDIMPVLSHNIEKLGYSNIKISGTTGLTFNLTMMIRDDYPLLKSIIDKTFKEMDLQEKNNIYKKWSTIKYEKEFDYSILLKFVLPLLFIIVIILYRNRELTNYQKKLKTIQNDLENSLKSFKTLVDLAVEGIAIIENKKIVFVNNQMCKIFHLKEKDLLGKDILSLFEKDAQNKLQNSIENNDSKNIELNGIKKSKELFPCIIKSKNSIINNNSSNIISVIDISQIKEKEKILINQSKMASLGEMIANIAHQWRQPLSFISTASSGLKMQSEYGNVSNEQIATTLDSITETTKFLSQTIDDFQDYLKKDKIKKEFFIDETIEKVLSILKGNYEHHSITIINKIDRECKAFGHQNELKQVILNILNNSKDALKNIHKSKRYIEISCHNKDNFTYIDIIDNGGGIKESILNKVFEPYFTTKHKKQGTGLGLYMTHKIINDSLKGTISISNCKYDFEDTIYEKSTKVSIKLPVS